MGFSCSSRGDSEVSVGTCSHCRDRVGRPSVRRVKGAPELSDPVGMPSRARTRLAWGYLAVGCGLTVGYFALHSVAAQDLWYDGVGLSAVVAILTGVLLHRPRRPLPWLLVAAGQFLWILG